MCTHPLRYAAFALALLALGAPLSAQGFGPGPGPAEGRGLRGLNLTEAQRAQVKALRERHEAAFKAKGEAAAAARKAMREAMADATIDAKTLQALHEKASTAQFDLRLERRALRLEILPLLTAAQKAQFERQPLGMGPHGGRGGDRGRAFGAGPHPGRRADCPLVRPS